MWAWLQHLTPSQLDTVVAVCAWTAFISLIVGASAGLIAHRADVRRQVLADRVFQVTDERVRELEENQTPRRLSEEQIGQLSQLLQGKGGPVLLQVILDPETSRFADDLIEALRRAGWPTTRTSVMNDPPRVGVWVRVKDPKNPPHHARILLSALRNAGIDAQDQAHDPLPNGTVGLLVGPKPMAVPDKDREE